MVCTYNVLQRQLVTAAQERHLALTDELAGATARIGRLTEAAVAADQQNAQLTIDLKAAQTQVNLEDSSMCPSCLDMGSRKTEKMP